MLKQQREDILSWKTLGGFEAIERAVADGTHTREEIRERNERISEVSHTTITNVDRPIERGISVPNDVAEQILADFKEGEMVDVVDPITGEIVQEENTMSKYINGLFPQRLPEFLKDTEYLYLRSKIFYHNKLYYIALDTLLIALEFEQDDKVYNLISKIYNILGNKELSKQVADPNLRLKAIASLKSELTGISQKGYEI